MHRLLFVTLLSAALVVGSSSATANPLVEDALDITGPLLPGGSIIGVGDIGPGCVTQVVVGRCQSSPQSGP